MYGGVFFAVSLICDFACKRYESIFFDRSIVVSIFVYTFILGCIVWSNIADAYSFNLIFTEQKKQMERQLAMQRAHYDMINDKIEETRRLRHDMRQHFRVMMGLIQKKEYDELSDYIKEIDDSSQYDLPPVTLCQNSLIDALLQYYERISEKNGIDFNVNLSASPSLPISDSDLIIILGNLFEHAYDACSSIHDEKKNAQ